MDFVLSLVKFHDAFYANNEIATAHPSWSICIWHLKHNVSGVCGIFLYVTVKLCQWDFYSWIHSCIVHLHFVSPYVWLRGHQQHVLGNLWANRHPPAPCAQHGVLFCSVWLVMNEEIALPVWTRGWRDHSHPQVLRTLLSFDGIWMINSACLWNGCIIWWTFDGPGIFLYIMYIRCC